MGLFVAQLLTGLANAAALFLVASGLSLIFGVTRIVNFAHGSFYMLGAFLGYSLMQVLPGMFGFWFSVLLAGLAVGAPQCIHGGRRKDHALPSEGNRR